MAQSDEKVELPGQEELFTYLVSTFYSSAWMQMGKMANPMTNKVERDLNQAQFTIDLLDMLQEKTKGNLSEDEDKLLTHAVKELKMNYMEEMKKEKPSATEEGENPAKTPEAPPKKNIITPDEFLDDDAEDTDEENRSSNLWTP